MFGSVTFLCFKAVAMDLSEQDLLLPVAGLMGTWRQQARSFCMTSLSRLVLTYLDLVVLDTASVASSFAAEQRNELLLYAVWSLIFILSCKTLSGGRQPTEMECHGSTLLRKYRMLIMIPKICFAASHRKPPQVKQSWAWNTCPDSLSWMQECDSYWSMANVWLSSASWDVAWGAV